MKKIIYLSISLLLITGVIVWFNFDWFKLVLAAGNDANTVSLLHMNGTDGSTTFTDSASGGTHTWTANDNAQIDTAQSKFGGASGLFDGTGDYVSTPDSDDWNFGSGDFTIDFWVRFNSLATNQVILWDRTEAGAGSYGWGVYWTTLNELIFGYSTLGTNWVEVYTTAWTASTNTWYHIAFVRSGTTLYIFVNGVSQVITGAGFGTNTIYNSTANLQVGRQESNPGLNGWLDEVRITKGLARWTADFTPPGCEYNGACPPPPKVPDIMIFE